MLPTTTLEISDLSKQRRFRRSLGTAELGPRHTVGHAIETYLDEMAIPGEDQRWTAFSRGQRLDLKQLLGEVPEQLNSWTVMPEIHAGAR